MIAYWRIQSLSSLLALSGVCSGSFCFGVLLGQSASQSPLGRAKRRDGAGVVALAIGSQTTAFLACAVSIAFIIYI